MADHSINLYFSHEVEQLASQLVDNVLREIRHTADPLVPSYVIVPNANMQRYLQLFMAEKQGISANLEFPFLEKGLSQYLNLFEARAEVPMWSQTELTIKIYAFLSTPELMADVAIKPINKYLIDQVNPALLSRKKWQLAQRLAVLFVSYELQRPEMVMQWLSDRSQFYRSDDQHLKDIEAAERHIYRHIMQATNQEGGQSLFRRFQLIDWQSTGKINQAMHLFTPTRLSAFHRHVLAHMAQFLPVNLYQLNVCCEYWEDLTTEQEDAWRKRINKQTIHVRDAAGLSLDADAIDGQEVYFELDDEATENPLLKAWAKPGRESLRLFSQLEDDAIHLNVAFQPDWLFSQTPRNQKALHLIQDSILNRSQQKCQLTTQEQLSTLQLAVAPSIHREVQAVYNSVLSNLSTDGNLQLTDIAILVPDMDKYRSVIEQVFAEQDRQHPFNLRYSLIDSSVKTESLYAQAVMGLFEVLEHDFMRAVVLKWLANDCVKAALELTDEALAEWLNWLSGLGIYSHFDQLYETPDAELSRRFTWQQGLKRLRQSLVSDEVMSLTQDTNLIGRLSWLIESMHQWHLKLQQPKIASEWQQLVAQIIDEFITVPEGHYKEEQVRLALDASMDKLVENAGHVAMTLTDIRYFLEQEFIHLSASKGNYLSGGLVCASLQPMRPIPFKVTYILGLDERSFPGELLQETLDLTQRSRRIGDINKIENMNYLFLETLMCTRQKLYLSYVGQDLIKDETILPSSTWQQLHQYTSTMLDEDSLGISSFPVTRIPLDSADLKQPDNDVFQSDWLYNFAPADYQKLQARLTHLSTESDSSNSHKPLISGQNIDVITEKKTAQAVQVNALAKFLENPVLSFLDQAGGSSQLIDDELNIEHEPFALDGLSRYQLFDAAVADYLEALNQQPISLTQAIDAQYQALSRQSQLPIQLFAELDKLYALEADKTFTDLQTELKTLKPLPGPVVFGEGINQLTPAHRLAATTLQADDQLFSLNGCWEGLYTTDGVISHQVVVSSSKASGWSKVLIKPFVYWCMAQLDKQIQVAELFQLRVIFRDKVQKVVLKPWSTGEISFSSQSTIRSYLSDLLQDFSQPSPVNLPFDAIAGLKVTTKDREQLIPYLGPKSTAKTVHAFAYASAELNSHEKTKVQKSYEEKVATWIENHSYYEMLKALELITDTDALGTYRRRLLPLHVMKEAVL
ncbi:exodeoxyribonuclease V subunit gamma [Marinicella sp. S1101]|uniref:exodeoxyribonuclease V subunit gamma n=1 Tax=Marinicella marina TaxID=2996016 RepID=UPI002260D12F|nr:exodeoxyribonuclease V subunit gamma [Marinicella marina]MCX7553489.1 exodeoxyribonuclease V subunit gamma [Marinicella marina]MDJ1140113.1 exodeoxyribonuclease V subunit gamma [Marinicella marina]